MEALVWRRRRESSPAARKGRAAARGLDARRCLQNASCQRWTLHLRRQAYQNHLDIDHGIYRGENHEPGKDFHRELDPTPGIREQPGSQSTDLVLWMQVRSNPVNVRWDLIRGARLECHFWN